MLDTVALHRDATFTEAAAAQRASSFAASLEARVLDLVIASGERGLTAPEAREALGMPIEKHYSVAPRLSVLRSKGLVAPNGQARDRHMAYAAVTARPAEKPPTTEPPRPKESAMSDLLCPPVSNSEIQTFQRCRRKWYLGYVRNLGLKRTEEPLTGALKFGTRIHTCLERHYEDGASLTEVYEELHAAELRQVERREGLRGITDTDARDKLQKERELAHAMLTGFEEWAAETGLDEGLEIVGVETVVEVPSGIPGVRLRGKLDQKVRREIDGAILFRDWKTADSLTTGPATLAINEQMLFYMMLERLNDETALTRGGLYTMLKKVKRTARATPPFYMQVDVRHNNREIESMWLRTHARLNEMLTAREQLAAGGDQRYWANPHPTRDCTWDCPFFAVCPMMDDSSDATWNGLLDATYDVIDPYERYVAEDAKG